MKKFKPAFFYMLIVAAFLLGIFFISMPESATTYTEMTYGELLSKIENKQIESLTIQLSEQDFTTLTAITKDGKEASVAIDQTSFMEYIRNLPADVREAMKVNTVYPQGRILATILNVGLIVIVCIVILSILMHQLQGGSGSSAGRIMNFGKSRAKMVIDEKGSITFDDVAGLEEEKEEVAEIVDFLKHRNRYIQVGAKIPKGVLLVGPPGTGKTLLAKAVAGKAGVPFFSISGSDFVEMYVGVGASRVRDLFDQAKKNAPCIVFIDEIDAVGRKRGSGLGGGHDEREQTLNQLLVEMDGFGVNEGVVVIAATNREDILDPALLRPGRFDRKVFVGMPDVKGREEILKVHAKGKPLQEDVDIRVIARTTAGFTGADLANLMNEAALLTARHNKRAIDMEEIQKAFVKLTVGTEKKSRVITEKDKRITAYHEVGHAIIHEKLENLDPVHSVSIIPAGYAAGYTMPIPNEDDTHLSKSKMLAEIVSFLGGRVAEELVIGDITTGASNDIERATKIARDMITKYGMSPLGPVKFHSDTYYGDNIATAIEEQVKKIMDECYEKAKQILEENMDIMHKAAEALMKKEKLTGNEFRKIMNGEEIDMDTPDELNIFEFAKKKLEQEEKVNLAKASDKEKVDLEKESDKKDPDLSE